MRTVSVSKSEKEAERKREPWVGELKSAFSSFSAAESLKSKKGRNRRET